MELSYSLQNKKAILEYWSLVEFFSPYILENVLDSKQNYQKLYAEETAKEPLPWINAEVIAENDTVTPFTKAFHLYLGLFSVEETKDRARHAFSRNPSNWQSVNWRSCADTSSTTCFARLTVTTHGIPLFGTLSLSTLPWAHGKLLDGKKESLTIEEYWKGVNRLLELLREEFSPQIPMKLVKEPKTQAHYFDIKALLKLMHYLHEWANFKPLGYPFILIEPLASNVNQVAHEPRIKTERDVPILNSFYIQDLEAAAMSLPNHRAKPIDRYLSDRHETRISLESHEGQRLILDTIRPEKIPSGRWPNSLLHQQNLMQQFTINAAFDSLQKEEIFSVNGPPGTGKTSLLQEIIAENIVRRAVCLSKFKIAKSALVGRRAISFEYADPIYLSELDPSLLGYEMLVVSSNNTAVQNLSQKLPLRSQLDPLFQNASYLEPVATRALGVKEKEAWGLIAATLGNKENCRRFVERAFTLSSEEKSSISIWEWVKEYSGPTFQEANDVFIALKIRQEELFYELQMVAILHDEIKGQDVESFCKHEWQTLIDIEKEEEALIKKLSHLLIEEVQHKELLDLLLEQEKLLKQERPNALTRIMDRSLTDTWNEKESLIRKKRLDSLEILHTCKTAQKELALQRKSLAEKESEIMEEFFDRALFFYAAQDTLESFKKTHPEVYIPSDTSTKEAHLESYYQTEETNRVRSELFIAALKLHEAWLAETLRPKGGFRGNLMAIVNVLQGKSPSTADDTSLVWQSIFLVIPVISSTFASIGRLFRHLEPGNLGWLFIDEAGQTLPQAAVGAIWRAERVLSMGDPFQIEPISTVPREVIEGMAKSKLKDYTLNWASSQVSVQILMDRTSSIGVHRSVGDESIWLGSPLRVHRRCSEPMFSIANSIAYENSMLLATLPTELLTLPKSCWWDISGSTSDRQYVPNQGNALLTLLKEIFSHMTDPDLFIISPFREVVTQIQHFVLNNKEINEIFAKKYPAIRLQEWIRFSIGTVHTFQGKQALAVFFVLGADKSTLGAIEWASRKPNLLNVAVTRARSRFYMIGDYDLWKIWPYFDVATKKLERRKLQPVQNL